MNLEYVLDYYIDVVISNNALEHTFHPLSEFKTIYQKIKPGSKMILVVPCESISYEYKADDINHHLYSWSPMCLGNLITEAGFELLDSKAYIHKWPPRYRLIAKFGGRPILDLACIIFGRLERSWFQVWAVAQKPK